MEWFVKEVAETPAWKWLSAKVVMSNNQVSSESVRKIN